MAQTEAQPAPAKPRVGRVADPCAMVIFGVSGDLTRRKLIPALYNLASQQLLSREFAVVGIGRTPMTTEEARKKYSEDFKQFATGAIDPDLWEWFVRRLHYVNGDFNDPATYDKLKETLAKVDQDHATHGNFFFYMATAPNYFGSVVEGLAQHGLMTEDNGHWRRVIIEKPFGHDLDSAKALNQQILKVATERQIYRIDHYLGKETRQGRIERGHLRAHLPGHDARVQGSTDDGYGSAARVCGRMFADLVVFRVGPIHQAVVLHIANHADHGPPGTAAARP